MNKKLHFKHEHTHNVWLTLKLYFCRAVYGLSQRREDDYHGCHRDNSRNRFRICVVASDKSPSTSRTIVLQ